MKNILLHIHKDDGLEARLDCALTLARATGGHLTCLQITPFEYYVGGDPFGGMYAFANVIDAVRDEEKTVRDAIVARLKREDVSWDWKKFDGNVIQTIIDQSRLADVIVLSQPAKSGNQIGNPLPIVAEIAVTARAPVLVVPTNGKICAPAGTALVAWNGSAESANALRLALPLLQIAGAVHIVVVDAGKGDFPSIDACSYLSRHGVHAELHEWPAKGRDTSVALLHAATELDVAYVVMGAYGHSRLRETILGGVTRDLINSCDVPLLLAH